VLERIASIVKAASERIEERPSAAGASQRSAVRWRALIAEDNKVNQALLKVILSKYECDVDVATNGLEAVNMSGRNEYRLILMDCQMPEMGGLEATAEIRRRHPGPREPVIIAVTANALPDEREACLRAGMNDYLVKPFRPEMLRALLEKWKVLK
jgi:CheY-like chemotaxis protein